MLGVAERRTRTGGSFSHMGLSLAGCSSVCWQYCHCIDSTIPRYYANNSLAPQMSLVTLKHRIYNCRHVQTVIFYLIILPHFQAALTHSSSPACTCACMHACKGLAGCFCRVHSAGGMPLSRASIAKLVLFSMTSSTHRHVSMRRKDFSQTERLSF